MVWIARKFDGLCFYHCHWLLHDGLALARDTGQKSKLQTWWKIFFKDRTFADGFTGRLLPSQFNNICMVWQLFFEMAKKKKKKGRKKEYVKLLRGKRISNLDSFMTKHPKLHMIFFKINYLLFYYTNFWKRRTFEWLISPMKIKQTYLNLRTFWSPWKPLSFGANLVSLYFFVWKWH